MDLTGFQFYGVSSLLWMENFEVYSFREVPVAQPSTPHRSWWADFMECFPICETSCLIGKLHAKGVLENHLKDQSFRWVHFFPISAEDQSRIQVVQRVPCGRQVYREFEPHLQVRSQGMLQALLSPTKSDEPDGPSALERVGRQWRGI